MVLIQFLQQFDLPPIVFLMKGFTLLGNVPAYPLYLLIGFFYIDQKKWFSFLGIILMSWAVNETLKHGFSLPRPPEDLHLISTSGFGFPSGHAQMAVVVWGWLGRQYNRLTLASVIIFLVGFTRIYLGVHFPHQVLAGWTIGFALLMVWIFMEQEFLSKQVNQELTP